jgi:hypothetical protein
MSGAHQSRHLIKNKISGVRTPVKAAPAVPCKEPCVMSAFHEWHAATLTPSFNFELNFTVPSGMRLVIELVTAWIQVPIGEAARLRMFTGLGTSPSNLDLVVTPQGVAGGQQVYVATHYLRAYTDGFLAFNINRDNALTPGYALICVSGHLVTP